MSETDEKKLKELAVDIDDIKNTNKQIERYVNNNNEKLDKVIKNINEIKKCNLSVYNYIKKMQMPICSYVIFILLSIFAIGLSIFFWLNVYALDNQDTFIIISIFIGIMIVIIVCFASINLIFSEDNRKRALLTYAYDEAIKKLEEDRDKHIEPPKKDMDSKVTQHPKPTEETITMNRYYKKAVTKIFETYCQNITSK